MTCMQEQYSQALRAGVEHFHHERTHQGKGHVPPLVELDEAGEELLKLVGVLLGRHNIGPRLLVVRRCRPASRLKQ
jgi:hypothetical protein